MIEKRYEFTVIEGKAIEKIIDEEAVAINHMILPKGDRLPEHFSNAPVYMIVSKGTVTLQLNKQAANVYHEGSIINIPYNVKMNVTNEHDPVLELFVIKAPGPKNYK
ncbi:MAG: cupin domain-containing protein [Alkaliphilus sp.]